MSLKGNLIMAALIGAVASFPASAQTIAGFAEAEKAYRLQTEGDHAAALVQARLAVQAAPKNGEYWALVAQEAGAIEEWRESAEAYRRSASLTEDSSSRGYRLRAASYAYVLGGDRASARLMLGQAADDPRVSMKGSVDWIMVSIAAGDDRLAQVLLDDMSLADIMTRQQLLDAAYSAKRRGLDLRAVELFRRGLDSETEAPLEVTRRAAIEREIATLANRWSLSGQLAYAGSDRPLALFNQPSTIGRTVQGGLELGYRPLGWQNGRPLTLFGRIFGATPLNDGDLTDDVLQGWVGLQYKPLSNVNLVLEASHLVPLNGAAISDWGLRAAFSQENQLVAFNGRSDWAAWRLYGDFAYLIDAEVSYGAFEGRYGRAFELNNIVITPHALAYAGFDSGRDDEWGSAVGLGMGARRWIRNGAGEVSLSHFDLTIQYREAILGAAEVGGFNVVLSFGG